MVFESRGADLTTATSKAFAQCRPLCAQLVKLDSNPQEMHKVLSALAQVLTELEPAGLLACYDYIMFPLLRMLGAIPAAKKSTNSLASRPEQDIEVPALKSDRVIEALLGCICELLVRCSSELQEDQQLVLLERLAMILALPADTIPEEILLSTLKCLAILMPTSESAYESSKSHGGFDMDTEEYDVDALLEQTQQHIKALGKGMSLGQEEKGPAAMRAILRNESNAPLVGYIILSCLTATETEVAQLAGLPAADGRPASGTSRGVCAASLGALHGLLTAVGNGQALAFFLPGLVSGLSKAVMALGAVPTGSATTTSALAAAIKTLMHAITLVMNDTTLQSYGITASMIKSGREPPAVGGLSAPATTASAALLQLQQLAGLSVGETVTQTEDKSHNEHAIVTGHDKDEKSPDQAADQVVDVATTPQQAMKQQFRVAMTPEWVHSSMGRVMTMLHTVLPPLANHFKQSVRSSLSAGVAQFLGSCSIALDDDARTFLTGLLLSLAQDDAAQVAQPATAFLERFLAPQYASPTPAPFISLSGAQLQGSQTTLVPAALLEDLIAGLLPAVKLGGSSGLLQARKLSSAMTYAGLPTMTSQLLQRPSLLSQLLKSLVVCFAYDPSKAKDVLIMKGLTGSMGLAQKYTPSNHTDIAQSQSTSTNPDQTPLVSGSTQQKQKQQHSGNTADATTIDRSVQEVVTDSMVAPNMPRVPVLAQFLVSQQLYRAVADIARQVGRLAILADEQKTAGLGRSHLRRVIDQILSFIVSAAPHVPSYQTHNLKPQKACRKHKKATDEKQPANHTGAENGSQWQLDRASEEFETWQQQVTAAVSLGSEVLYGASPAWSAAKNAPCNTENLTAQRKLSGAWISCVRAVVDVTLADRNLMALPTSISEYQSLSSDTAGQQASSMQLKPTLKEVGQHALVVRSLLDLGSTLAHALGHQLASSPAVFRAILIAALERYADPCVAVSAAASDTVACLATHGGYGSFRQLVAVNADYIVDAVCEQLRDLDKFPRAPAMLASLLRSGGGASAALLPVMAEPLAASVRGLSIMSRWRSTANIHPFVRLLVEVAKGAAAEGIDASGTAVAAQQDIKDRVTKMRAEREQQRIEKARQHAVRKAAQDKSNLDPGKSDGSSNIEEIKAYFMSRAEEKAKTGITPDDDEEEQWLRSVLTRQDMDLMDQRFRRLHGAAVTAGAIVDACAPLLLNRELKVAVGAVEAITLSLHTLAKTTPAIQIDKQLVEELGAPTTGRPVPPDSPKLQPAVVGVWPLLIQALQDDRTPVVEAALQLLGKVTREGGGAFMARRFASEAAPLLGRLLVHGTAHLPTSSGRLTGSSSQTLNPASSHRKSLNGSSWNIVASGTDSDGLVIVGPGGGAADVDSGLAHGAIERVRVAALECIRDVCACKEARVTVKPLSWGLAQACAPFLGQSHTQSVQNAALAALLVVAQIDSDCVWLMMQDIQSQAQGSNIAISGNVPVTTPPGCMPLNELLPVQITNNSVGLVSPTQSRNKPSNISAASPTSAGRKSVSGTRETGKRTVSTATSVPLPSTSSITSPTLPWPVTVSMAEECAANAAIIMGHLSTLPATLAKEVPLVLET